jgi:hypothetical protein
VDSAPAPIRREVPRLARYDENGEYRRLSPSPERTGGCGELEVGENKRHIKERETRIRGRKWTAREKYIMWIGGAVVLNVGVVISLKFAIGSLIKGQKHQ